MGESVMGGSKINETDEDSTYRTNVSWPTAVDELARKLAKDGKFNSLSEFLRELVLEEAKNPRLKKFEDQPTLREIVRSILKEEADRLEESGKQDLAEAAKLKKYPPAKRWKK